MKIKPNDFTIDPNLTDLFPKNNPQQFYYEIIGGNYCSVPTLVYYGLGGGTGPVFGPKAPPFGVDIDIPAGSTIELFIQVRRNDDGLNGSVETIDASYSSFSSTQQNFTTVNSHTDIVDWFTSNNIDAVINSNILNQERSRLLHLILQA